MAATTPSDARGHLERLTRLPAGITGTVGGGTGIWVIAYIGAPWWVVVPCLVLLIVVTGAVSFLPQESGHRRDVFRDFLQHRQRMVQLRREPPWSQSRECAGAPVRRAAPSPPRRGLRGSGHAGRRE